MARDPEARAEIGQRRWARLPAEVDAAAVQILEEAADSLVGQRRGPVALADVLADRRDSGVCSAASHGVGDDQPPVRCGEVAITVASLGVLSGKRFDDLGGQLVAEAAERCVGRPPGDRRGPSAAG